MLEDPRHRADEWIACWNRRDVEAVLAHYAEDAVFLSPKAAVIVGDGRIEGKAALRAYWLRALERYADIRFTLDGVLWDAAASTLAVVYVAALDGQRVRATEVMRLGDDGRVVHGEAFYGAPIS